MAKHSPVIGRYVTIDVDGCEYKVFYLRNGSGVPLVCQHTAGCHNHQWRDLLEDPANNLDLGQRYVAYLAGHEAVNGNLVRLLAAYNAGPANFARFAAQIRDNGDPLLFIEAIPLDETRAHVPRVLTYTWIYAALMHLPSPSLDELAGGLWPRYHPYDEPRVASAHLH